MRTSFDIPDHLFRQLRRRAAEEGTAMRDILLQALRSYLTAPRAAAFELAWTTTPGRPLVPDEILTSRAALDDWMDRQERRSRP